MVEMLPVSRPYANAIFALADSASLIDEWGDVLHFLSLVTQDVQAQRLFKNPKITSAQSVEFLVDILPKEMLEKKPGFEEHVTNFIHLIVHNQRIMAIPAIFQKFRQLVDAQKQVINLKVIAAFPLNDALRTELLTALKKRFSANIDVDYEIDNSLIGGIIVRKGNWVLDDSIRSKLQRLNHYLVNAVNTQPGILGEF